MPECPICSTAVPAPREDRPWTAYDCPRCGRWRAHASPSAIDFTLLRTIGEWDAGAVHRRSRLSHILRRQQSTNSLVWADIRFDDLVSWRLEEPLPSPSEQLDQIIILAGKTQPSAAEPAVLKAPAISAWIGATILRTSPEAGLSWLWAQDKTNELIEHPGDQNGLRLRLRMAGWLRYEILRQGQVESRRVLMAMQFGDVELDRVVEQCFRPAARRAGFDLYSLIENQPAGLIDDQLRVALRTSRFVVADLTHRNNGAYWEAGFAEGLGRPVIYTCREAEWKERPTHFDTNHLVTVIWNNANLETAGAQLTATIRATLPAEATLTD
jgi:hypothetical protein